MKTQNNILIHGKTISTRWLFVAVFIFAFLVRGGWIVAHLGELGKDTDAYLHVAHNLAKHGVLGIGEGVPMKDFGPTATRPPLYPVLLSLAASSAGEISPVRSGALNLLLGQLTVCFIWMFARRAAPRHPMAAVISALLVTLDPLLLTYSSQSMTETPSACLTALCCLLFSLAADSRKLGFSAAFGVALGLAAQCRTTYLPLVPLAAMVLIWIRREKCGSLIARFRSSSLAGILCLMGAVAALSPWMIRNYRVFGKPMASTTHGGYAFAVASSPDYLAYVQGNGRSKGPWDLATFDATISANYPVLSSYKAGALSPSSDPQLELAMNAYLYQLGIEWIQADPGAFAFLTMDRFVQFWNPMPHTSGPDESPLRARMRHLVGLWYGFVFGVAMIALLALGGRAVESPLIWPVVMCVLFTAIHLLFWSNLRMRAPVMPCVSVFAALGIVAVWSLACERMKKHRAHRINGVARALREVEI